MLTPSSSQMAPLEVATNRDQISRIRVALTDQVSSSLQRGGAAGGSLPMRAVGCRSEWLVDLLLGPAPLGSLARWGLIWNF